MQTLGQPNELVSKAVDVRSELDLRIGILYNSMINFNTFSID